MVPIRPGEDPSVKTSREELTRGVVITYVDDLMGPGKARFRVFGLPGAEGLKDSWKLQTGSLGKSAPRVCQNFRGNSDVT